MYNTNMEYKRIKDTFVVKISKNELVRESLDKLLNKENIAFAKISAIGALEEITLGWLKEDGTYIKKEFNDTYELLSLKGSIAGNNVAHMHASISGKDFKAHGGHFFEAKVAGVVEMFIEIVSDQRIDKKQKPEDLFPTWDLT